jgi:tetratricopeptide (TPR) repeat protein
MKQATIRTVSKVWFWKFLYLVLLCLLPQSLYAQAQDNYRDYSSLLQSGIAKHKKHKFSEAINDYTKAISLAESPDNPYSNQQSEDYNPQYFMGSMSDLYFNRGLAKSENAEKEGALKDFNKSVNYNSQNDSAYFNRGLVEFELKQYQSALKDFNKTISLVPGDAKALYNRALTKFELGDETGALKDANLARRYFLMLHKRQEAGEVGDFIDSVNNKD